MKKLIIIMAVAITIIFCGCSQSDTTAANDSDRSPHTEALVSAVTVTEPQQPTALGLQPSEKQSSSNDGYSPPTSEELAPIRPEYLEELAKIDEPPEMAKKPMQVRKPASPVALRAAAVISALGSAEKATHDQRAAAINDMLELTKNKELDDSSARTALYGAIAMLACIDGADPHTVIGYANNAAGDASDDALALRARMYFKVNELGKALDDLEKIMLHNNETALSNGDTDPRKESVPCGWSITDFDAFGSDPRALAAKGYYLSSFLAFGAQSRGTVREADIRELYKRSARLWRSPIPHYIVKSLYGLGTEHSMNGARCMRSSDAPKTVSACASHDEGVRQQIRELTMALVIDPTFAPALSARANMYLRLAQGLYADAKPSRRLYELAIKDYTAALAAGSEQKHALYCDRALAQALIGMYQDAVLGYEQGMNYAKNGIENDPFVYTQLAGVYLKMGRFDNAAATITQAIMSASGSGMDVVIFSGGIKGFRTLYQEYDLLPDEILADVIRRRYFSNFPKKWNDEFISHPTRTGGKILSSILPELYVIRGDAYMKGGQREKALADYQRVKSNAWRGEESYAPRHIYFDEGGARNIALPEPFPPPPAKL